MNRVNQGKAHTALLRDILATLGARPGVVMALNPCGKAKYMTEGGETFVTPYGWPMPGGPDILVAMAPHGRLVGLEGKTGGAVLSAEQRKVHAALKAVGVVVAVVHSVEEAARALEEARQEERTL